jgi:nucleoside-diphosphate-sugar epimerase
MASLPDVDYVIHLAAHTGVRDSLENPHEYFNNNIISTKLIFDHYALTNTKILFASTSAVKELKSPYAMSKYACELIAPWNCVIMRFFTVYGGINYRKNMLYGLAKDNKLEYLTDQSRDYTHIDDVCRAIKLIMEDGKCKEIYEVGNGTPIHNRDFLKEIGYTKKLPFKEVVGESISTCANNTTLKSLGW